MWKFDNWVDFTMVNDKIYRLDYESDSYTGVRQIEQLKQTFDTPTFYKDFESNPDFPENGYRMEDETFDNRKIFRIGVTRSGFNYKNKAWSIYVKTNPPKAEAIDYFITKRGLSKNFVPAYWYGKKYDTVDRSISWKMVDLAHNYDMPKVIEDYLVKYPDYVPYYAVSFGDPGLEDYVDVYVQYDRRFIPNWQRRFAPGVIENYSYVPDYEKFFRDTEEYCRSNELHCGWTPRGKEMQIFQNDATEKVALSGRGEFCFGFVYNKKTMEILKIKTYIMKVNRRFCSEYYNNRGYDGYEAF